MSMESGSCWRCGRDLPPGAYGRTETCSGCDADTRSCKNCRFYDPGTPNDCKEPMVERVPDKEKANFCELFKPGEPGAANPGSGRPAPGKTDAKSAFDALFKKPE
jgi:hypothetical protein